MRKDLSNGIARAADSIANLGGTAALTGAGVSVPSGIPDFRSPGGLWTRYDPMEYATIEAFLGDPRKVWKFLKEMDNVISAAEPNPAHDALARLEEMGVLEGVITQNVDGLHQRAGSKKVVEYHGSGRRLMCPACGRKKEPHPSLSFPPICECGQTMKPDVVLFGEAIPIEALEGAARLAEGANVLIVAGTSAEVAPASAIPRAAAAAGAVVVEVNLERTGLSATVTDVFLQGPAEVILPALVTEVEKRR